MAVPANEVETIAGFRACPDPFAIEHDVDEAGLADRGSGHERLDQLVTELLLGVR